MIGVFGENAKILLMLVVFFATYFGIVSIHIITTRQRTQVLERLSGLKKKQEQFSDVRQVELDAPFFERAIHPVLTKLADKTKKLLPSEKSAFLQRRLVMAGNPGNLSTNEFTVLQYVLAVMLAIITMTISAVLADLTQPQVVVLATLAATFGYTLPMVYINSRIAARKQLIQNELPDVLDLLTISVDAGLGFDAALVKVVEKSNGVLKAEFSKLLQEIKKGKARRDAMRDMAERCQVTDLTTFVGALVQADQLGVSISNVIRLQAEQMRQKRRQLAEERAMKAPVKMLFPLIFFIFPTIFIVLLGPAIIQIFETFSSF